MDIRLIIFDFDGTIGDTRRNIVKTLQMTMEKMGLPVSSEAECAATIGLTLDDAFRRLHPQLGAAEASRCTECYRVLFEIYKKELVPQPFPHVIETLGRLKRRGYRMTIASSRSHLSLDGFVRDMQLGAYVDYVLGAEDAVRPKPDPAPVLKTLKDLGYRAGETLVVGDMPYDILMGSRAGAATCGVSYGNSSRDELLSCGADYVIDEFSELETVLDCDLPDEKAKVL